MRFGALVVTLLIFTIGGSSSADDARAARQHFDDGSKLYDLGKFRQAAHEYEEAYQAKPDPALLFNIGQAYRAAGDATEAITAYKAYLRHVPEARNRADVEAHLARLQRTLDEQRAAAPTTASPPATTTMTTPTLVAAPPTVTARPPLYKRWWLWTAVGGVAAGVIVGLAVAYSLPKDAPAPSGAFPVSF